MSFQLSPDVIVEIHPILLLIPLLFLALSLMRIASNLYVGRQIGRLLKSGSGQGLRRD